MEKKKRTILDNLFKKSVISIIIATIAAFLGVMIDGIVIGRFLGPDCMAAYGLTTPITNLTSVFSGILSTGTQIVCAQRLGIGDVKGVRKTFSASVIITAVISFILVAVIILFRDKIAVLLGATGESAYLLPYVSDYLLGLSFSLPMLIILFESNALMRLDGDANRVVIAVGTMTVLDIAGDLLNALVIKKGMLGMGMATSFSYLVAVIILAFHFTKKDRLLRFHIKGIRWSDYKDILITGSPSAVGSVSAVFRNTVLNHIMVATILSGTAVGAFGIMNSILGFAQCVMIGIGLTSAMIAGMILGEQDGSAAEDLVKISVKVNLIIGGFLTVVIAVFAGPIAGLFGNKDGVEMVSLATRGLRIYAFSIILYGLNNTFVNYTQGLRRMGYSVLYSFLQNFVFIAIPALALAKVLDTDAVWFSFLIGETATLLSILLLAAIQKKGVPYRAKDFLFLPKDFGVPENDLYEASITDSSEVNSVSIAVGEFCESHGADQKEKNMISLFVEEIGNNITRYGFESGKKKSIDIRLIRKDSEWILRLRDNCRLFDPTEWIKKHEDEDPSKNIGIRMVCRMAEDVKYLNTLDLNNLILTIREK